VFTGELMLPALKCWKARLCAIQQNTQ